MSDHVWGTPTYGGFRDAGECVKCGLVASAWDIARDRHQGGLLPPCKPQKAA